LLLVHRVDPNCGCIETQGNLSRIVRRLWTVDAVDLEECYPSEFPFELSYGIPIWSTDVGDTSGELASLTEAEVDSRRGNRHAPRPIQSRLQPQLASFYHQESCRNASTICHCYWSIGSSLNLKDTGADRRRDLNAGLPCTHLAFRNGSPPSGSHQIG
jgi:hypothetical protein